MKMHSSSIFLISSMISILVASFLALPCEEGLKLSLLADKIYSDVPKESKNLHTGEGAGISGVPTQAPIRQNGVHRTKLLDLVHFRKAKTTIPNSAGEQSWEVYYRVALKISSAHGQISEIKQLAQAVMRLGDKFASLEYLDVDTLQLIVSSMDIAHRALQLHSLGVRERIWAVGVISCLKWSIPTQRPIIMSKHYIHSYPFVGFRGNFELFLLRDQPLRAIVEKMWEGHPTDEDLSVDAVIWEALQRSSLADSVMHQFPGDQKDLFEEFRGILSSFLHLKSPIGFRNGSRFINDIARRLGDFDGIDPLHQSGFDEAKALIQFLFYMHENCIHSRDTFLQLTKNRQLPKSVLDYDIIIPCGYGRQPKKESVRKIHSDLMENRGRDIEELIPVLKVLAQERLLIPLLSELSLLS
ncbi:hypothetical protein DFH28DRAFT_949847 [Melampsora americana]|nr:hypothetical protein DFH28DRAFT_949847 [Melampsora americana]